MSGVTDWGHTGTEGAGQVLVLVVCGWAVGALWTGHRGRVLVSKEQHVSVSEGLGPGGTSNWPQEGDG